MQTQFSRSSSSPSRPAAQAPTTERPQPGGQAQPGGRAETSISAVAGEGGKGGGAMMMYAGAVCAFALAYAVEYFFDFVPYV